MSTEMREEEIKKGEAFEQFVESKLFPAEIYKIVHRTPRSHERTRFIENQLKPDYQFRHKASGKVFWVECKYRSYLYKGKLHWAKEYTFERYKQMEKLLEHPFFLVAGVGNKPEDPQRIFGIPMRFINKTEISEAHLYRFERPTGRHFVFQKDRLY